MYNKTKNISFLLVMCAAILSLPLLNSCKTNKQGGDDKPLVKLTPVGPDFNADSAYNYCQAQCDFGPRVMNSKAHDDCGKWIVQKADNDPDSANWHKPVMAANDGASGVAVLLELARIVNEADSLNMGVDFVCFDAEDYGAPQWSDAPDRGDSWALGAQYWSQNPHKQGYEATYGILLDMVGGQGAQFYQEGMSMQYAPMIVKKIHTAAKVVGFGSFFPEKSNGPITDDHVPVNQNAKIPTADIIVTTWTISTATR